MRPYSDSQSFRASAMNCSACFNRYTVYPWCSKIVEKRFRPALVCDFGCSRRPRRRTIVRLYLSCRQGSDGQCHGHGSVGNRGPSSSLVWHRRMQKTHCKSGIWMSMSWHCKYVNHRMGPLHESESRTWNPCDRIQHSTEKLFQSKLCGKCGDTLRHVPGRQPQKLENKFTETPNTQVSLHLIKIHSNNSIPRLLVQKE